jgi:uncharacterized membrane protein YphA (DoxX/SURF4 family)
MEDNLNAEEWSERIPTEKFSEKLFFRFSFVFVILFVGSFSFPQNYIPDFGKYGSPFFEMMARWSGVHIFGITHPCTYELVSDSTGMYINAFNIFFISILVSVGWSFIDRQRKNYARLRYWFFVLIRYYLALQLFVYGFNKFFKWQFYLPEPNTLFTSMGNTPKDLLYWSSMGTSRLYSMFTGSLEILAATFLLFRKTLLTGVLISLGIMINVLMINFGFDISVKLYSCFLLFLCCILILPDAKRLFQFFFSDKTFTKEKWSPEFYVGKKRWIYLLAKFLIVAIIILDPLSLYLKSGNFNDDAFPRPLMHGAYDVTLFVKNSDTLLPLQNDTLRWKRVFIHRRGYFITQGMNDEMEDYSLDNYIEGKKLIIMNYDGSVKTFFNYEKTSDSTFSLNGKLRGDSLTIHLRKIDLGKLPLNDVGFHWTIDP